MDTNDILFFIIPISVAIVLTLLHFLGEKISQRMHKWHFHLESLGAGLMVGILFLELLPQVIVGVTVLDSYLFIPLLMGFVIIALVEKIIYKWILNDNPKSNVKMHVHSEQQLENSVKGEVVQYEKDLTEIDCIVPEHNAIFEAIALITHGLMIGILVALIFYENLLEVGFIIVIPFFIRAFTVAFSAEQIFEDLAPRTQKIFRIISFTTPTLGAIIGIFLVFSPIAFFIVFAFALGLVLFTVIRDLIPLGKKGKPGFFIIGIVFTITTFLITELVIHG